MIAWVRAAIFAVACVLSCSLSAQPATQDARIADALSLRDRMQYLTDGVADPAVWSPAGDAFHYRRTVIGGFRFVSVRLADRERRDMFDHARLAAAIGAVTGGEYRADRLPFDSFAFEGDDRTLRITVADRRLRCSLASYVCATVAPPPGRPRAFGVTRDMRVPADATPRRSPDGRHEATVEGDNLVVREVASGRQVIRTSDGSPGLFYDPETIAWSPDSRRLALYRVRPGHQRMIYRVASSPPDRLEPKLITQLYPKPGDVVDLERPVLFTLDGARQVDVDPALFDNPYQLSPLAWRSDSASLGFTYNQRGHGVYRLVEVDAVSGTPREVVAERSDTFVYAPRMDHRDVDGTGREIVWMSERSGWNHLYLVDGRTGRTRPITQGDWVVRRIVHVDAERRQVYFAANGREKGDPYLQHFYRIGLDGRGLVRLTEAEAFHDVSFAPDMAHYVDTYSRIDLPPVSELRRTSDGALVATLEQADISQLTAAGWQTPETFIAKGRDGVTDIWGVIVRPRDFDPAKRYPVIENIYGAGFDNFVPKKWWPFGYHAGGDEVVGMQAQADLGYIVVQIDGMGTLNRSKAFHDVTWKNVGEGGAPDRILWHKAAAARYRQYDASRVGLYGGSLGGQNALGGLLFFPDFYKAAVAYNGCHDNRMDKISWNEQWMGWPVDESYSRSSNVDNAWRLKGDLLLIVGELDMNVDPAVSMQVADRLIKAGKDFELLVVPGGDHGVGRTEAPFDEVLGRQYDFFARTLGAPQPTR
ncbi:DPP IV N-terminal domain-containing protein [Sphingomonas baiyangensis]|uniref:S9 family peptidase n=1 Tax=Sphingomonas baiyangensis TaxID=2572576 RepID=A0A4U1L5Y9_9SPHN|nr:DPP IV N-terminal domain-containing protein [Sphingomonas baiyangensis]TKD51626.1 S9 family peptidase [Sphingomonas baiyangensis]